MSDRELLELAARAAEMKGHWDEKDDGWFVPRSGGGWASLMRWDPLSSDGDALRLAVKLRFGIVHGWESFAEEPLATVWISHDGQCLAEEIKGEDPFSATRRAIVRAAAEIGKQMEIENV